MFMIKLPKPHLITKWKDGKIVERFWKSWKAGRIIEEFPIEDGYFILAPPPPALRTILGLVVDILNVCLVWVQVKVTKYKE